MPSMQSVKMVQYKHIKFVWTNDKEPDINSQMTKLSIKPQLVVDAILRSACVLVVPRPWSHGDDAGYGSCCVTITATSVFPAPALLCNILID